MYTYKFAYNFINTYICQWLYVIFFYFMFINMNIVILIFLNIIGTLIQLHSQLRTMKLKILFKCLKMVIIF